VVFDAAVDAVVTDTNDSEAPRVEVISVSTEGVSGNADAVFAAISRNQRFVAFGSEASNLVAGDLNGVRDIFLRDRTKRTTERISLGRLGVEGDGLSNDPSISDDGRYVAFASKASNFATTDTNLTWDVFLLDRQDNRLSCLSCDPAGGTADKQSLQARISGDGRFVVFQSDAALTPDHPNVAGNVYLYARETGSLTVVSQSADKGPANGKSWYPAISRTGDLIAFDSIASNLVSDDTNGERDVFSFTPGTQYIARVSVATDGSQGQHLSSVPALAADAPVVAFMSWSHLFVTPSVYNMDVYVRDIAAGTTRRMSQSAAGVQGDRESWFPSLSADGRFVAFDSPAETLTSDATAGLLHVYVRDRASDTITRVASTGGANNVSFVKLTDDGLALVFATNDSALAPGGHRQIVWVRR
jgi:Tol biopolymer transport system component